MPDTVREAESGDVWAKGHGSESLRSTVREAAADTVVENAALKDEHGHAGHGETPHGSRLALLSLAALGIVYGDIGTSVLYSLRECFHGPHAIPATPVNIYGVLSLVF
jgi:hypothetical protein